MSRFLNPTDITAEPGNVLLRRSDSVYEINQELKVVRSWTDGSTIGPTGEWVPYERVHSKGLGCGIFHNVSIDFPGDSQRTVIVCCCRIEGTLVEPPCTRTLTLQPSEKS